MSSGSRTSNPEARKKATPSEGWDAYVSRKADKRRQGTMQRAKDSWDLFTEWCHSVGIEYLSDLDPYFPGDFREWLEDSTEKGDLAVYYTITRMRQVAKVAQNRGFIHQHYPHDNWDRPEITDEDRQRDEYLLPGRGLEVSDFVRLEYTNQKEHVIWKLAWDYGLRKSAIRSLDLEHVVLDPQDGNPPHLNLQDRPGLEIEEDEDDDEDVEEDDEDDEEGDVLGEKGLPLKNPLDWLAGRRVPIREDMVEVLREYIDNERTDNGKDKFGLNALITTSRSPRISENGIYTIICKLTSPATYRDTCDCEAHQEFREKHGQTCDCEWCETYTLKENREIPTQDRYKCDESRCPHAVRHGSITHMVNEGHEFDTISHVVGTSIDTLEKIYDRRSDTDRMNAMAGAWLNDD